MSKHSYKKYTDYSVEMMSQEDNNMRVLRGKALLNAQESRLTFVQNEPRGPRSVEVFRTPHARLVRRPDGLYTATFRFAAGEKMLLPALISEVRATVLAAQANLVHENTQGEKGVDK